MKNLIKTLIAVIFILNSCSNSTQNSNDNYEEAVSTKNEQVNEVDGNTDNQSLENNQATEHEETEPEYYESDDFESEDPIEFYIPTTEELTAGSSVLPLMYNTLFIKKIATNKNAFLFLEEENTEIIGGTPAKSYKIVSTLTGKITQVIPISYNADIGEGVVLLEDMTEDEISEFNEINRIEAEKTIETYQFKEVTEYTHRLTANVAQIGNEWVFSISSKKEIDIIMEVYRFPSIEGRTIEIVEVIEPYDYGQLAIISYTIPGSMEYPASLNGVYVVSESQLSVLYKKIGGAYYDKIEGESNPNKDNVNKCIENLSNSLSLNGANAEAAFYFASVYAHLKDEYNCVQVLEHLKRINSSDSEGYLEMVKEEAVFNDINWQ